MVPSSPREQFIMGGIMGRINAQNDKLLRLQADQKQPIQPHELDSYLFPCLFYFVLFLGKNNNTKTKQKPSSIGDLLFYGRLSESYLKTSLAFLHFLRKMLYMCVTIYTLGMCVYVLVFCVLHLETCTIEVKRGTSSAVNT